MQEMGGNQDLRLLSPAELPGRQMRSGGAVVPVRFKGHGVASSRVHVWFRASGSCQAVKPLLTYWFNEFNAYQHVN